MPSAAPAPQQHAASQAQTIPGLDVAIPGIAPAQPAPGAAPAAPAAKPQDQQLQRQQPPAGAKPAKPRGARSENYYDIKTTIFNALIDAIDLTQLGQLDRDAARDEIRDIVNEIISLKDVAMSIAEQEELLQDICNDVLGYGPLEPLLALQLLVLRLGSGCCRRLARSRCDTRNGHVQSRYRLSLCSGMLLGRRRSRRHHPRHGWRSRCCLRRMLHLRCMRRRCWCISPFSKHLLLLPQHRQQLSQRRPAGLVDLRTG
jgi:hypothetical protein